MLQFCVLTLALIAAGTTPARQGVADEIARLREWSGRMVAGSRKDTVDATLKRAGAARDADRLYLALYELETPFEVQSAYAFVAASADVRTTADFAARWKTLRPPVVQRPRDSKRRPLVVEALAASADARGPATYRASLPYAEDVGIEAGLYYLGESQAVASFAAFCRSLDWPDEGTPPAQRSLTGELSAFEASVVRAYEGVSADDRRSFITINVRLKHAHQLDSDGRYAGALLEYLLARYDFARLRLVSDSAAASDGINRARSALPHAVDHSIALLFLDLAAAGSRDDGGRAAAAVLNDVLPAYFEVVKR